MASDTPASAPRVVLHCDMDAFFASIAQLDDPSLRGKPVIVGGQSLRRGVVASASYEARAFGVRSAMPLYQALEKCPWARVVPTRMTRYREVNQHLREIWARFSPLVEVASFDEAYLELTGCEALLGPAPQIARTLQKAILDETGLTCSIGVGPSKLVAKVASKRYKPHGLCVVPAGEEAAWLAPLAIGELHGIGPATAAKLAAIGLHRVHQLLEVPPEDLVRYLGSQAASLIEMARGRDHRPVSPSAPAKSIGAETTFEQPTAEATRLKAVIYDRIQEVAFRLRRAGLLARTLTLKLRYADFETITRAVTLNAPTDDEQALAEAALALFGAHAAPERPLRLVGVTLSHFSTVSQLSLWESPERAERRELQATLDQLRDRHGLWIVSRGTHLRPPKGA